MKRFFLILTILFIGCKKEKTFADDIVLSFTKDEKLTIQEFNEDGNEAGTNLFYKGYDSGKVEIKYFKNIMPEPPPPPGINEKKLSDRINTFRDSLKNVQSPYFRNEEIEILETKEDLYDSINNETAQIIVKEKDTIPLYKRDYATNEIKKHKAFPVFIKNISTKTLRIPIDGPAVALYVSNNSQFQFIRNSNYTIMNCLELPENPYFKLKPNEILIYSFPHLKKGTKRKSKIVFFKASSKEFDISIDEQIIKNQRSIHYQE
ncbi:hypothetical protein [Chryseobacterium caseinilyticum]|uniref:Lipoprotein n=1 Tax=Chryseobacterium caseinilyticum TaxID=2771428 RepID=A0ABR8ZDA4_9FLAO|nr:hypothetical protein [Chryseobacterium caseinilyticum]MBD8083054.1 hypothetical protein [Chryseobacterium caseinilyticum]